MRMLLAIALLSLSLGALELRSPNDRIRVRVEAGEHLTWSIQRGEQAVLEASPLGVVLDGADLGLGASLGEAQSRVVAEDFPYRGNKDRVSHDSRATTIAMRTGGTAWTLEIRVFDDAAAFRCLIPGEGKRRVQGESTAFRLPAGSHLWFQPALHAYEARYIDKPVEQLKEDDKSGPPLTFRLADGSYGAITEACLDHYSGMTLRGTKEPRTLAAQFVCNGGGWDATGPITTPWRVVMAAPDLDGLVNCDAIACLAPAPDPARYPQGQATPWIQPGRCVWSWLGGGGVNVANMNEYARLAGQLGYEYNLVDEGWGHWSEPGRDKWDMIAEVVRYGERHGVKTWVWKSSGDRRGIPGIRERGPRREFFAKCHELGIAGVKIDFMDSESTDLVDFYNRTLEDAADFQLMIDFHGAFKPTGEARTYPNELTREGIRGFEARAPWARHNTILPFTRYLAGHGDYTPLSFGGRRGETTWAHQLASSVIFTSPFLCLGEHPKNILANPTCEWLKALPATWAETHVLPCSEIGQVAGFVRRDAGGNWYVAVMNGTEAREVTVSTAFLGPGAYLAQILADDPVRADAFAMTDGTRERGQNLDVKLSANGGYVARFSRLLLLPHAGSFKEDLTVRLHRADPEAVVRYTLDGSQPTATSPLFGEELTLTDSAVLRARVMTGLGADGEVSARYTRIQPPVLEILPEVRLLSLPAQVTIRTGLADADLRYTVDGSAPTADSPRYTGPFELTGDATVRVRLVSAKLAQPLVAARAYRVLPPVPPMPQVFLGDLAWVSGRSGWGGAPKKDRSIEGHPIKLGGKEYARGIGTHAESELVYDLKPTYTQFVAVVGTDEEIESTGSPSMVFQVVVDDRLLAESPLIGKGEVWHLQVPLPPGGKRLALKVTKGPDGINHDHGDWANAGFLTR